MKVFLGGTCNNSDWRNFIINELTIDYFNPVVDDWTHDCVAEEIRQRETCDFCLYVITPKMTGTYSIAEVIDDSNKQPEKTIFCFMEGDGFDQFTKGQIKSLEQVGVMVVRNGALWLGSLTKVIDYLNSLQIKGS